MYKGEVNMEAFGRYAPMLKHPICYNGDIVTIADLENVQAIMPGIDRVMIGRGILQNPFLLAEIKNLQVSTVEKVSMLKAFHLSLIERCKEKYSGDLNILRRLEEMWAYHADGFVNGRKVFKQVKKCNTLAKYEVVLFKAIKELV
jgi:tRNA-dihydrouridine synthase B